MGESPNSVLQLLLKLCGPKTELSVEKKIRGFAIIRNEPELLSKVQIERNIRGDFIIDDLISPEYVVPGFIIIGPLGIYCDTFGEIFSRVFSGRHNETYQIP